jgi:hypothetical protein
MLRRRIRGGRPSFLNTNVDRDIDGGNRRTNQQTKRKGETEVMSCLSVYREDATRQASSSFTWKQPYALLLLVEESRTENLEKAWEPRKEKEAKAETLELEGQSLAMFEV